MKQYTITIEYLKDILGSSIANEDIAKTYIINKMMQGRTGLSGEIATQKLDEEFENLKQDKALQEKIDEIEDKALTIFYRNHEGIPSLADHQIKGWLKDTIAFLVGEGEITGKAFNKKKDSGTYAKDWIKRWVSERVMFPGKCRFFPFDYRGEIKLYDRPLRAKTMQGDRVCLASSELIPAGTQCTFQVILYDSFTDEFLSKALNRGKLWGISQWSNAGFGTFKVVKANVEDYEEEPVKFG